jgi:hypothetical protein
VSLSGRHSMCHGVPLQGGMGGCRMLSPLGMGMQIPSAVWNPSVDAVDLASVETAGHKLTTTLTGLSNATYTMPETPLRQWFEVLLRVSHRTGSRSDPCQQWPVALIVASPGGGIKLIVYGQYRHKIGHGQQRRRTLGHGSMSELKIRKRRDWKCSRVSFHRIYPERLFYLSR